MDHKEYLKILRRLRALPGVKKVFIRSGIRYDYLILDKDETFFKELIQHHVSGQLKVAPEHCAVSYTHLYPDTTVQGPRVHGWIPDRSWSRLR